MFQTETKPRAARRERPVSAISVGEASEETGLPVQGILKLLRQMRVFGMRLGDAVFISPAALPLLESEVRRLERIGALPQSR